MKLGRDYILTIDVPPYAPSPTFANFLVAQKSIVIKPPYALEFDIRREFMGSSQNATFRIRNLQESTRNSIYHDYYAGTYIQGVTLKAGYRGSFMTTIFDGRIRQASSYRYDRKNFATEILGWGFAEGASYSSLALPGSQPLANVLNRLNGDLVGISQTPIIGTLPQGTLGPRPLVLVGPTFDLIQKIIPPWMGASIDSNRLLVLADGDVIQYGGKPFVISKATGLLDPPVREETFITCKMLFEPRISIGQFVTLQSEDNSMFNGNYQVRGVSHSGIISPSDGGAATTTVNLYLGLGFFNILTGAAPAPSL